MKSQTAHLICNEVERARRKFPRTRHLMVALVEEVGELAQAHLHANQEEIRSEAVQVAAMAVRVIEEGDESFIDWPAQI